jgi:hypothetical protein
MWVLKIKLSKKLSQNGFTNIISHNQIWPYPFLFYFSFIDRFTRFYQDVRPFTCSSCEFYIQSSSVERIYKKFSLEKKNGCHKTLYTVVLGHYNDTELIWRLITILPGVVRIEDVLNLFALP